MKGGKKSSGVDGMGGEDRYSSESGSGSGGGRWKMGDGWNKRASVEEWLSAKVKKRFGKELI